MKIKVQRLLHLSSENRDFCAAGTGKNRYRSKDTHILPYGT